MSVSAHVCILAGVFVSGVWRLERLDPGKREFRLGIQPPPPPAPSGGKAPDAPVIAAKAKPVVHGAHQPVIKPEITKPVEPEIGGGDAVGPGKGPGGPDAIGTCTENCGEGPAAPPPAPVCGNGVVEAGEQCDDGNTAGGDGCSATCRIVIKPAVVAPAMLQALRISGETQLHPSTVTQNQMARDGKSRVEGIINLCVATSGAVTSLTQRSSTGYPEYDQRLLEAVRDWRYRPYLVNGAPVPVCSIVRFVYTMNN
ncbi:MAG TPA: TonB family protein [Kofleriaceae bacterium]